MTSAERRLASHGLVYMVGRALQVVAYVAVMPLVTRQLDADAFGQVALALVVFQAIAAVAPLGLTTVVAWSIYDDGPAGTAAAQRLLVTVAGLSAGVVVVAQVTGPGWSGIFADLDYSGPLPIAVWLVLPFCIQAAALSIFQAQGRPAAFVASTAVSTIGGQCCGLVLLADHGTPTAYLAGILIGSVAGAALALLLLPLRTLRPAAERAVRAGIAHGGPTVVHLLGFMVLALADRVLVERILGLDAAARYQVAYVVGSAGSVLLYGLNNAWGPMVYAEADDGRWATLVRSSVQLAWLMSLVVVGVAMAAPLGLRILAPASYDLAGLTPVSVLIAAATVFDFAYLAAVHVLFKTKRTAALLIIMPIAAAANVGLNLLLLDAWGLVGAGLCTLAGYLLMAVLTIRASRIVADVPWNQRGLAVPFAVAATGIAAALALPVNGAGLGLRLLIATVAGAVLLRGVWQVVGPDAGSPAPPNGARLPEPAG